MTRQARRCVWLVLLTAVATVSLGIYSIWTPVRLDAAGFEIVASDGVLDAIILSEGGPRFVSWTWPMGDNWRQRLENAMSLPSYRTYGGYSTWRLPLWLPLLALTLAGIYLWRSARPFPDGACPRCGYNLTANTSGSCPECGRRIQGNY